MKQSFWYVVIYMPFSLENYDEAVFSPPLQWLVDLTNVRLLGKMSFVFQGAGAFEVAARQHLVNEVMKTVQGVN